MKQQILNFGALTVAAFLASSVVGCNKLESKEAETGTHATVALDDAAFVAKVEGGSGVAMVDFWAEWCGPCKVVAPVVEAVAAKYEGKVLVGKVDVDSVPAAPKKYKIRSIPSLLFFKDGKKVGQITGVVSQAVIEKELAKHL